MDIEMPIPDFSVSSAYFSNLFLEKFADFSAEIGDIFNNPSRSVLRSRFFNESVPDASATGNPNSGIPLVFD